MIGANCRITSYRLQTNSEGKQSFVQSMTIKGVPARIDRERTDNAALVDQDNVFNIYRLETNKKLDIEESDIVRDEYNTEYRVHTVMREYAREYGHHTICILAKKRGTKNNS